MTADIVNGVEIAVNIENAHGFAVDLDALAATCLDLSRCTDFDEIRHLSIPFNRRKFPLTIRS
jgi:hypothetical protein